MTKAVSGNKHPTEPHAGIYWWYRGKVVAFTEPVSAVEPVEHVHDSALGHDPMWPQVQRQYPPLRDKEYYDIPRGRVLYVADRDEYWLFAPAVLHTRVTVIGRIIRRFGLPPEKVHLKTDTHYEPAPMEWEDE